jgi:hypothetical protein
MMKKLIAVFVVLGMTATFSGCKKESEPEKYNKLAADPVFIHQSSQQLTDVIVHDVFKPPVASRIYSYAFLAAYEVLQKQTDGTASFGGKLNGFSEVPAPEEGKEYCYPLASTKAFAVVGEALTFSADKWAEFNKVFFDRYKEMGIPQEVYDRSMEYGTRVANHILAYANGDNYRTTRGFRYTLTHLPGKWEPTPPSYAEACEPQWNTVRTFTLDSASQFAPRPPAEFSLEKDSNFVKLTMEVYEVGKNLTEEQKAIAYFWDDNPFVTNLVGHASFTEKKMTPAGHWMEICRTVSQNKKLDMLSALQAYTLAAMATFDGFIASWDAKYQYERIRPITVINSSIDKEWVSFLENPPFPEYSSAHSAISAAAGKVLTHLMGRNVAFTDSTEYEYGHGIRSFKSFEDAYLETSISRVYGGIHYRDGVEEGTLQGERIGEWIVDRLKPAVTVSLIKE